MEFLKQMVEKFEIQYMGGETVLGSEVTEVEDDVLGPRGFRV